MTASSPSYEVRAGLADVAGFDVIGVSVVTAQETAADDMNTLWESLFKKSVGQKVEDKIDDTIYCVYSDYEGDHEKPFRVTLGYRVKDGAAAPTGFLHRVHIKAQEYAVMSAAGQQPRALIETWEAIWSSDLNRSFITDFEVYGPRFFEEGLHEALIHVGIK